MFGSACKTAECGLLVGKVRENSVEIRQPQDLSRAWTEVHRAEFGTILPRGIKAPNKLANTGAIEVRDITEIQNHAQAAFTKQVEQQFMNCLAFDHREAPSDIDHRHIAHLAGTCTETQSWPSQGLGNPHSSARLPEI